MLHRLQLGFLQRGLICFGERKIHRFVKKDLHAIHSLNDFAGRMARTETGNLHLLDLLFVCFLNSGRKFVLANLNGHGDHIFFMLFDIFQIHFVYPPFRVQFISHAVYNFNRNSMKKLLFFLFIHRFFSIGNADNPLRSGKNQRPRAFPR